MAKANRTCIVCGEQYHYCNNCHVEEPAWRTIFHDENCKTIFETINQKYFEHISEDEAIQTLMTCDLSVLESDAANEKIACTVDEMVNKKGSKRTKKTKSE